MDKLASALDKLYLTKTAVDVNVVTRRAVQRTPELSALFKKLTSAALSRKKGLTTQRLIGHGGAGTALGVASAIGSSASNPVIGALIALAALSAIGSKVIMPKINDKKLRSKLQKEYGEEEGEEVANLSQRVYNASRSNPIARILDSGIFGFMEDIGGAGKRERATSDILRRIENLEVDPSAHVSPYSFTR